MTTASDLSPLARRPFHRHVFVIPITADGRPQIGSRAIGTATDLSSVDVMLAFDYVAQPLTGDLIVGIEGPDGALAWVGAVVASTPEAPPGQTRLLCRFGGRGQLLLRPETLSARLDTRSRRHILGLPVEVLDLWTELGVLSYRSPGLAACCPGCGCVPTFRGGCPGCGNSLLGTAWLLHHFRCGHSGLVDDWRGRRFLTCPKCERSGLACGSEFLCEVGHRCSACDWVGADLETFGHCPVCRDQFPADQAVQFEIPGYQTSRFDPAVATAGVLTPPGSKR